MINLGPYSGKNCPNVRFQPTYPPFSSLFVVINLPLPTNGYSFSSFRNF